MVRQILKSSVSDAFNDASRNNGISQETEFFRLIYDSLAYSLLICGMHLPAITNCNNQKLVMIKNPMCRGLECKGAWIYVVAVVLCYKKVVTTGLCH